MAADRQQTGAGVRVERRSPWLLAFNAGGPATRRLFCFPFAGGGASAFRGLAQAVPAGTGICSVQLPGREDRYSESALTSIPMLVSALLPALRPHFNLPFSFFGHSMGALVAFELAREMRRHPNTPQPEHLFVSGRRAPHLPGRRRAIYALPSAEFWNEITGLQGTPAEVLAERDLMDLVEPILRADFQATETYRCREEAPLATPITAFGGAQDPETTLGELEGWREHTRQFGGVRFFPGHHFYLQSQWVALGDAITTAPLAGADG